jgi:hypothetical protein
VKGHFITLIYLAFGSILLSLRKGSEWEKTNIVEGTSNAHRFDPIFGERAPHKEHA